MKSKLYGDTTIYKHLMSNLMDMGLVEESLGVTGRIQDLTKIRQSVGTEGEVFYAIKDGLNTQVSVVDLKGNEYISTYVLVNKHLIYMLFELGTIELVHYQMLELVGEETRKIDSFSKITDEDIDIRVHLDGEGHFKFLAVYTDLKSYILAEEGEVNQYKKQLVIDEVMDIIVIMMPHLHPDKKTDNELDEHLKVKSFQIASVVTDRYSEMWSGESRNSNFTMFFGQSNYLYEFHVGNNAMTVKEAVVYQREGDGFKRVAYLTEQGDLLQHTI